MASCNIVIFSHVFVAVSMEIIQMIKILIQKDAVL